MDKTAIKNFSIWARNKLIADVSYRAGLMGITANGIDKPLPQSTETTEFYHIGTSEPYQIFGEAILQRRRLVEVLERKARETDYGTAYQYVLEEVAYTWFNRLIAIRFMEVNDYLPSHIRVLSSETGKLEPDLVTTPFDAGLDFTSDEKDAILRMQQDNDTDGLFHLLFIKQCNTLNAILPGLFEQTNDYTELLLSLSVIDKEGVVYHLVYDIGEDNFNVKKGGQVEIIGWLYQYWNTEPKAAVFGRPSGTNIKKEEIPAATQLFTPHWIVRYMVENSLGRLWLEGHPDDGLKAQWKYYLDEAEQKPEVQTQLAEIRKEYVTLNPEGIRCIDPCCGSGHILAYMFDVLVQIYKNRGYSAGDAAQSIVRFNLHGLDIDKRAAQLAYFSVMMKARQYDRRFFSRGIQPHIYAIVDSEWIGGAYQYEMGNFLLSKEHQETLNYLLEVFREAKEYGSILQLESRDYEGLLDAWKGHAEATTENFNLTLWYSAVKSAVPQLVEQAILLSQKYDVVVTNPPYMAVSNASGKLQEYVKKNFPDSKADLFAVFIERCGQLAKKYGFQGMITQHAWMFLSSFEKLRGKLRAVDTVNMVHLGPRAFEEIGGEVVQATSFVMRRSHTKDYSGTYCRLVKSITQQGKEDMFLAGENRFIVQQDNFSKIPGSPEAYWVNEGVLSAFQKGKTLSSIARTRQGLASSDNNRFLKLWWEPSYCNIGFNMKNAADAKQSSCTWFPCNKGGEFRKWYGNNAYVVNWKDDGKEILEYAAKLYGSPTRTIKNIPYYFMGGMTWGTITSGKLSMRHSPVGFIPEHAGGMIPLSVWDEKAKYILGFMNTNVATEFLSFLSPTLRFTEGSVGLVPVIQSKEYEKIVATLTDSCEHLSKNDWDSFETSWDFRCHPLVEYRHSVSKINSSDSWYLKNAYEAWEYQCQLRFDTLKASEEELNRIFIDIYGLQDELTPAVEDKDVTARKADLGRDIRSLLSYAVGCMFGRYSLDVEGLAYAGGTWDASKYSTFLPDADSTIPITDEEYLDDDIVSRLCAWLKTVYGPDTLEENLDFIAKALGNKGATCREIIRNYFLKDFFADHCKIYQKRPIYWLFDSGKQSGFKALIYLHRYTPDTIGNVRVDYLHRLQRIYESEIDRMQDMIDHSKNPHEASGAAKRKEKLQKQLKECRDYDGKIGHLALSRIALDLDDGVKVNYEKVQTASDGKRYSILEKI